MFRQSQRHYQRKFVPSLTPAVTASLLTKRSTLLHDYDEYYYRRTVFIPSQQAAPAPASLVVGKRHYLGVSEDSTVRPKRVVLTAPVQQPASLIFTRKPVMVEAEPHFWRSTQRFIPSLFVPRQSLVYWSDRPRQAALSAIHAQELQLNYHYQPKYEPNILTVAAPPTPLAIAAKPFRYQQESFDYYFRVNNYVRPSVQPGFAGPSQSFGVLSTVGNSFGIKSLVVNSHGELSAVLETKGVNSHL